jgi:CO/xanthine dehydrogenase Mo-binding subunit
VDVETGQVNLLQAVAVHEIGRAINPVGAKGKLRAASSRESVTR